MPSMMEMKRTLKNFVALEGSIFKEGFNRQGIRPAIGAGGFTRQQWSEGIS
jgi:hypothetical protein